MKLTITSSIIFMFFRVDFGLAQYISLDSVFVSHDKTTYLVFDHPFQPNTDFVDLGTTGFHSKIEGSAVFLKASKKGSSPTTLMIKNGDTYYHGVIGYREHPENMFYDYRGSSTDPNSDTPVPEVKSSQVPPAVIRGSENKKVSSNDELLLVEERLETLMNTTVELRTLGVVKDRIILAVTNVMADDNALYLKLLINNKSSGKYEIDFVNFQFVEPSKGNGLKKSPSKTTDVFPITQTQAQTVNAYQKQWLGYALPLFNISDRGKLIISFREINGSRILKLEVPAKTILKTKVFES